MIGSDMPANPAKVSLPTSKTISPAPREPRSRGRPRDSNVEQRVFKAALTIFGHHGLSGLSIDAVASRAKVGKTSIYLRWKDKLHLLIDAIEDYRHKNHPVTIVEAQGTDVRARLIEVMTGRAAALFGQHGLAIARLEVEMAANPKIWKAYRDKHYVSAVLRSRHWLQEAIDNGQIRTQSTAMQILEAVEGSLYIHAIVTPPELRDQVRAALPEWIESLVDTQLRLAAAR